MHQNGITHTNRGKEGRLNMEVAPQLLHFDFAGSVHPTDEHSKLNASFSNFSCSFILSLI